MQITDKHLFNFVYYPGFLNEKEYLFIKKNLSKFNNKVEYLKTLKKSEEVELAKEDEKKIVDKILKRIAK